MWRGRARYFSTYTSPLPNADSASDLARELERLVGILHGTGGAWNDRHADFRHRLSRCRLVAHHADLLRRRTDEGDVGGDTSLRELGVLGEEPVARVNGVRPGDLRGRDEARDLEIRVARGRRSYADVIVGEAHVQRFAVRFRVHGHGLDVELLARPDHPQSNLAAVGNENLVEHSGSGSGRSGRVRERRAVSHRRHAGSRPS
jgi:hypothetical protein